MARPWIFEYKLRRQSLFDSERYLHPCCESGFKPKLQDPPRIFTGATLSTTTTTLLDSQEVQRQADVKNNVFRNDVISMGFEILLQSTMPYLIVDIIY